MVYKYFNFVPSPVPASVENVMGQKRVCFPGMNSVPERKRRIGDLDS